MILKAIFSGCVPTYLTNNSVKELSYIENFAGFTFLAQDLVLVTSRFQNINPQAVLKDKSPSFVALNGQEEDLIVLEST